MKLVRREPHVDRQLINRLQELVGGSKRVVQKLKSGQRTFSELEAIAQLAQTKRETKEHNAAKKKRDKALEAMIPKEEQMWQQVLELIELKKAKPYDEATALLKDLRDLAAYQGRSVDFRQRFNQLKIDCQSRPALIDRFKKIQP